MPFTFPCVPEMCICFRNSILKSEMSPEYREMVLLSQIQISLATCEIKRMYVVPQARRAGVARALLAELEDAARDLGYRICRLDTGSRQPHAQAFYESVGYRRVGNFNNNPAAAFHGEKRLA